MSRGPRRGEQALLLMVVTTVSLSILHDVLPHLVPSIVVVGLVVVIVRVVFDRTRPW